MAEPDDETTDEDRLEERERFERPHDDVFLPDGSIIPPMSMLDDPSDETPTE